MAEIFANIEVNRDPRWRVLLGLIVASLMLHMIGLVSVIYVPALRDAFNIASLIAQTSVVDKPYARTKIGDEVDVVQLSTEKFHYPDGYFSLEVPSETIAQTVVPPADPFAPKIISRAPVSEEKPRRMPSPSPAPTA